MKIFKAPDRKLGRWREQPEQQSLTGAAVVRTVLMPKVPSPDEIVQAILDDIRRSERQPKQGPDQTFGFESCVD